MSLDRIGSGFKGCFKESSNSRNVVIEAANLLRVSTSTVYKLCTEGKLGHVRISNAIRISETALRVYA